MSTWSTDDLGVLWSTVLGLVAIVFTGILISLVIERSSESSSASAELEKVMATNKETIAALTVTREQLESRWKAKRDLPVITEADLQQLQSELAAQGRRAEELKERIRILHRDIKGIDEEALDYRKRYRVNARANAVGETITILTLPDGRKYHNAVIRKYDLTGIQIHHEGGIAGIAYRELPEDLKDRFQWDPKEEKAPKRPAGVIYRPQDQKRNPPAVGQATEEQRARDAAIAKARESVIRHRTNYRAAQREASVARSRSHGAERSVPGSLETWAERAIRMQGLADKSRSLYEAAKIELEKVSPKDPLLRRR